MKSLFLLLCFLLPYLINGQSLLSCNFTTVNQTARGGTYQYYALTLHFSGAVSIPGYTTATSPDLSVRNLIWWQVRERMRFVSDRQPDLDIVVSKDFQIDPAANFYYNTDLILANSLRLNVAKHLDNGEQITVSYWRPSVAPLVDLLVGGTAMGDFSCTATMPNVTRLVQQSTLTTTSVGPLDTLALTFSRPVVRCGGLGEAVNVTDLRFASGDLLSAACQSLSSYSDQRVYYCRSFTAGYASYITNNYFLPLWPVNVCDRATNAGVAMDTFSWGYLNRGYSQQLGMALATYELWALNTTSRALALAWPASSWVPPVPDSASYLRLGVSGDSQARWYPISGWSPAANDTFLGLYPLSVPELGIGISSYYAPGPLVCVNILSRVVQTLGSPSGLTVTFGFAFYDDVLPSQYSFTFALYSGATNLLALTTSNPSLGVYVFAGSTAYYSSSSVVGYLYTTGYSAGTDTTQVYSQKISIQTANPLPIRLVAATQVAFTLTLTFNNSLSLSQAILARLTYSCGTLSDLTITGSQTVQVTSSHQYCADGTLTLSADAVWTSEQAFPTAQVFTDIEGTVLPLFNGTCSIEQISDSYWSTTTRQYAGKFYAVVLHFNFPVSFSLSENPASSPDVAWPRVRSRMRITTSRSPDLEILLAREQPYLPVSSVLSNPYAISGNQLRVVPGVVLEEGENVTVRYWQPPVATFVDLLAGGFSVPSFECTATMPAATRLISQVTVNDYLYDRVQFPSLPAMVTETIALTFSRPVQRCDTGGVLTPDNFRVMGNAVPPASLSVLCTGVESVYDQRVWRCTGYALNTDYMYTSSSAFNGAASRFAAYIEPVNVCDRERNTTAVSDSRNCGEGWLTGRQGILMWDTNWFGQAWMYDPASRAYQAFFEPCGVYLPVNASSNATQIFFQGGLEYGSAMMWLPRETANLEDATSMSPFLDQYRVVSPALNSTMAFMKVPGTEFYVEMFTVYRPSLLQRLVQDIRDGQLCVTYSFSETAPISTPETSTYVLIALDLNVSMNVLTTLATQLEGPVWCVPEWTIFRSDLYGYVEAVSNGATAGYMEIYVDPLNATVDLLRLASATLSADGTTLRLVFNQTTGDVLLSFNPSLVTLSCGTPLTLVTFGSTFVDLATEGLCPVASLSLASNLTWTNSSWFYLSQTFSSFNYTPLVFTEVRLINGSLLELYVPLEADASELFFDPALLQLTCNGSSDPATVYPNGTVTGCWPPLGVRLEILGAGALTDGVRELDESLVGTEWIVFVSSEVNEDCQYTPCPGPPGPKNRNDFFRLSIGWILGATLIPGLVGWLLGFILGLKLIPPIQYHLVAHDVFRVGDVELE